MGTMHRAGINPPTLQVPTGHEGVARRPQMWVDYMEVRRVI